MRRATIRSGRHLYIRVEAGHSTVGIAAGMDGVIESENGHFLTLTEARRVQGALAAAIATIEARQAGRGA